MTSRLLFVLGSVLALTLVGGAGAAVPVRAAAVTLPVQCEIGTETLLAWDDVSYDLRGTCGVVRVAADDATVTMPAATRLLVEGAGNTIVAKPLAAVTITGAGTALSTPSIQHLEVTGSGSQVTVTGLVEGAVLAGTGSALSADIVNVLRLQGSDTVSARKAFRTRVTGSDNVVRLRRSDRLVLTGARNAVTVERGRTTVRDRGADNVLDLRPRKRR